jgi:plastocyanin
LCSLLGCGDAARPRTPEALVIAGDSIFLPLGARIHDLVVRYQATAGEFGPQEVEVHVGDVLRFTAIDAGSHALTLDSHTNTGLVRDFLDRTGQRRSPPLLHAGATWIVSLDQAPTGEYVVYCVTHSDSARIEVTLNR